MQFQEDKNIYIYSSFYASRITQKTGNIPPKSNNITKTN